MDDACVHCSEPIQRVRGRWVHADELRRCPGGSTIATEVREEEILARLGKTGETP